MGGKISSSPSFQTAARQGQWSIALGGIPVNLHLENKGLGLLSFANEWFSGTNHNYLEIRGPKGDVFRRIQTQEANMKPIGRMLAAAYGSEGTDFSKDEIYHDDPNRRFPNMLRSGDNPGQTGTLFTGTKEQVLGLYHQGLSGVLEGNNLDLRYNALPGGNNGNAFTAEILQHMQQAALANGYVVRDDFRPKGNNAAFDKDRFNFASGREICFNSEQELLDAITALEEKVSEQHAAIKIDDKVDLETKIPASAALACPLKP
ncbi:MAG: hypothetical protein HY370_01770 [Proteobacteria bacterium]|nr:hypothetical protein [Pseudomonadota bacterium]